MQGTAGPIDRAALERLDREDPLAHLREEFNLPEGVVYLDGNSLGPLPRRTPERLARMLQEEWGRDLIRGWTERGWLELPLALGDKLARIIGAPAGTVVVSDTTSINLFKLLTAALRLCPDRRTIITEACNFPTDVYIAEGLLDLLGGGRRLVRIEADEDPAEAVDDDTAVVMLTHVDYRSGRMHDMARITAAAQHRGALMLWDLAHSAGAVPLDLGGCNVDLAVGCGYKYLNGGPGAPAFLYVAERWQHELNQPLWGWLGHAEPFAFEPRYRPAAGIGRALCSSPPIAAMVALECGLDLMLQADPAELRRKSLALGDHFIALVEQECASAGLILFTPREHARRGSQVCFRHPAARPVMQALIAREVIGDFREPDVLRFGLCPLYLRYTDLWDAVAVLREVLPAREVRP